MQTCMNNSAVKFYITNGIRYLEILKEDLRTNEKYYEIYSEVIYWISSLELLRNYLIKDIVCLKFDTDFIEVEESLAEILDEMSSTLHIVSNYLEDNQSKALSISLNYCKKALETLK